MSAVASCRTRKRVKRAVLCALTIAGLAAAPAPAGAADTVIVPGAVAPRMTALDGSMV